MANQAVPRREGVLLEGSLWTSFHQRRYSTMELSHLLVDQEYAKPPITVQFEIPYFTVSGIQIRYLKIVDKSGYQAIPWVIFGDLLFTTVGEIPYKEWRLSN